MLKHASKGYFHRSHVQTSKSIVVHVMCCYSLPQCEMHVTCSHGVGENWLAPTGGHGCPFANPLGLLRGVAEGQSKHVSTRQHREKIVSETCP